MIIDHVESVELSDDEMEHHHLEINYLMHLETGLRYLSDEVKNVEGELKARNRRASQVSTQNTRMTVLDFNHPMNSFVVCAFDWFSVTACSYAGIVGWLANGVQPPKKRRKLALEYRRRVLPEVSVWRDKVGAHPALIDPREKDTLADLDMSIMSMVFPINGTFYAGATRLNKHLEEQMISSRRDMKWSLTHTYELLSSRYWPASQ